NAEHDAVRTLKTFCKSLNSFPNLSLCRTHRLVRNSLVFRADRFAVEVRQVLLPHVKCVDHRIGVQSLVSIQESIGHSDGRRLRTARRTLNVEHKHKRFPFCQPKKGIGATPRAPRALAALMDGPSAPRWKSDARRRAGRYHVL